MNASSPRTPANAILVAAAAVIVIAGMKSAASLLIPFLLSVFIAVLSAPIMGWLRRKGIPEFLALILVLAGFMLTGVLLVTFVGSTINAFYQDLPTYESKLTALTAETADRLRTYGVDISREALAEMVNPAAAMGMVRNVFNGLSSVLANTFLILFTVAFMLLEASSLPAKLKRTLGEQTQALEHFGRFSHLVQRYLVMKTIVSLFTGVSIGIALAIIGVDYSIMWALVAFLLNYIPTIGSIIAAVPAVLVALIQLGPGEALITAIVYLAANTFYGNIVEPKMMGQTLGLSTLVVFLSLVFWGWVLGPVGMLLSIPLTMVVKIALETRDSTRWIAVLLGN